MRRSVHLKAQVGRRLRLETLECRRVLAASSFVPLPVITLDGNFQVSIAADIDADGDQDIIASTKERVSWFEAEDGEYVERLLPNGQFESPFVHAADFDQDGDLDLFVSRANARESPDWNEGRISELLWYENTNGQGAFSEPRRLASSQSVGNQVIQLVDLDGDGFQDILWNNLIPTVAGVFEWLRNDGTGQYTTIPIARDYALELSTYDIDEDGDLDVLANLHGRDFPGNTYWFERNPDNTFERHLIEFGFASLTDLDTDGDPDVLQSVWGINSGLAWSENLEAGSFGESAIVVESDDTIRDFWAEDFDLDGRVDLLVKSRGSNFDLFPGLGKAQFGLPRQVIDDIDYDYQHFRAQDMDADGDLDLFYMRGEKGEFGWIENRLAGDVNNDNQVNFADFLRFAEGFGESLAAWSEGDLDGDGNVSFADFLILADNFGSNRLA